MIHPHTHLEFINDIIGHGVVATQLIPAGTITWALDDLDQEFTPQQVQDMKPFHQEIIDFYSYRNKLGNFVLCWDHGRFVNHSFKSNCLSTAYDFEIAIRDIHPGEQLTDDYGYLNISEPFDAVDEGTDRKTVYPNDLSSNHKIWDAQLLEVFHKIPQVEQKLRMLVKNKTWETVEAVAEGKKEMTSILDNLYVAENVEVGSMK